MQRFKHQRIRDPLHDLIEFQETRFDDMLWKVIQTTPFQRLRRIRQLGFSELVYPGATHTRFAHSIGVLHIARKLMAIIEKHLDQGFDQHRANVALAASLVHDVGHGPFSHSFETIGKKLGLKYAKHEDVSDELITNGEIADVLNGFQANFADEVAEMISAEFPKDIYSSVVSSQFDADRLDYMQRDRLMTGTQHSQIDFTWLVSNLEIGSVEYGVEEEVLGEVDSFVLNSKAFFAAETYVVGLFQLYPTVYFHKATRCAEKIFQQLILRIVKLVSEKKTKDIGLSRKHPIIQFALKPNDINNILTLDDSVIWGALPELSKAKDTKVSELAERLHKRNLHKSINIRDEITKELGPQKNEKIDDVCKAISIELESWLTYAENENKIIVDQALREPYKRLKEGAGKLNQILIQQNGNCVDLKTVSNIVNAIETFKLMCVYYDGSDLETKEMVLGVIKEKCKEEENVI